ncbi:MAG: preprotein translocase subunit YajC [Alphaproteobacteria bacterium]
MPTLILFGLMALIFYFFLIRPQSKRQKEHQALLEKLKRGDEVVTSGGLIGRVHSVTDTVITIEVSQNVRIRVVRGQIAGLHKSETKDE